MMRLMGAMEIFTAQQQEDIKDEVRSEGQLLVSVCHITFSGGRPFLAVN